VLLTTLRLGALLDVCLRADFEGAFLTGCWVFCLFIVILQPARIFRPEDASECLPLSRSV
jgi:hypothetical protein